MKPFNLEAALAGKKVTTGKGEQVRILCTDRVHSNNYPIIALVMKATGDEALYTYNKDGKYLHEGHPSKDLYMVPVKVTKWANLYWTSQSKQDIDTGGVFHTEEAARSAGKSRKEYITTVPFTYEEE